MAWTELKTLCQILVSISEIILIVQLTFIGGLFFRKFTIERYRIIEVKNIDTGVTTNSEIDFEYGIFSGSDGTDRKKMELHRIKFLDENNAEKTIKVPLTSIEAKLLSQDIMHNYNNQYTII
jgi:hypothetical protein